MKKTIALILAALVVLAAFSACGKKTVTTSPTDSATPADETENFNELLAIYKAPAEVVTLDLTKADPSTDELTFNYNEDGSVKNYWFTVEGKRFLVTYTDKGTYIQIFAFTEGGTVIADETVEYKAGYNANGGFTEQNGYFFKGYTF